MSLVFATTFFFFLFFFYLGGGGGGGGGVLCHSAVQTDFEFEISGPLIVGTRVPTIYVLSKNKKNITFFHMKIVSFNNSCILNRLVKAMV